MQEKEQTHCSRFVMGKVNVKVAGRTGNGKQENCMLIFTQGKSSCSKDMFNVFGVYCDGFRFEAQQIKH